MKYREIPPPMRNALGTFEMLRRMGFAAEEIRWHLGEGQMMFVVLQTQGQTFAIRVGVLDGYSDERFEAEWTKIAAALVSGAISDGDYSRMFAECEAYTQTGDLALALDAKGIRIPQLVN